MTALPFRECATLGCTKQATQRSGHCRLHLTQPKTGTHTGGRPLDPELRAEIIRRVHRFERKVDIARDLGVHVKTVHKVMSDHNKSRGVS